MVTWSVTSMTARKQDAGHADVVYLVDWLASDTDGEHTALRGGQTEIPLSDNFTPYDQLTEQQVLGWVWGVMGDLTKAAIEADLNFQILYMIDPPDISPPLPWE